MKKWIEFFDAMRGFAFFLIVYSHILTFGFSPDFVLENFSYDRVIVMFMLPLFFFISGIVSYNSNTLWNFSFLIKYLKDKFILLIIPTTTVLVLYNYIFDYNLLGSLFDDAKRGYWFTYSLFAFFFVYGLSCVIAYKLHLNSLVKNIFLVGGPFLFLLIAIPTVSVQYLGVDKSFFNLLSLPEFKYYVYFIMGILVRQYFDRFQAMLDQRYSLGIIGGLCMLITIYFSKHGMFSNGLYNHAFLLVINILWLTVIFAFFRKYEWVFSGSNRFGKVIQFIGRRTLDIYLLHYFFLPRNMYFIKDFFIENSLPIVEFIFAMILSSVVIFLSLLISQLIRTSDLLGHYLLGAKQKAPNKPDVRVSSDGILSVSATAADNSQNEIAKKIS